MRLQCLTTALAVIWILALTGCTVGPNYEQPALSTFPDAWNVAATEGVVAGDAPLQTWWTVLDDAT